VVNERAKELQFLLYAELAALGSAVLFCRLFGLGRLAALLLLLGAAAAAPFLERAALAGKREHQRFCDVNSYMQQFISGMILHKRVAAALEEVYLTFPDGQMHETVRHMLRLIQHSPNIGNAEKEAFDYLYACYPNSQVTLIHDFAMRVEKRGGEFETEMKLLSQKREKWEKRTEHCQNAMKLTVYSSVLLYATMILVCAMVQRMMPADLTVLDSPLSQASEVLFILLFYFFIYMVLRSLAGGWMRCDVLMDGQQAKKSLAYLKRWHPANRSKASRFSSLMLLHRLRYRIVLHKVKNEMATAVPRWLFDVCLLMQKYNITVSITESLKTAPEVLRDDIRKLLDRLKRNPSGVDAYLSFLEEYRIQNVKSTMRMLISIQNGAAGDSHMQMEQLIAHNMNMLDELDAKETELRDAWNIRYNIYPMIPGAVVMGGYLVSMVIRIFQLMQELL
jgi:hypothetical protein